MKILLVTSEYGIEGGGLSFACSRFYNILSNSLGHDVTIVSSCDNPVVTARGGYSPTLASKIANEFRLKNDVFKYKNLKVDLIIAFSGSFNGYYATLLAKRLRVSLYLMLRGTDVNMAKWSCQEAFYLKKAAAEAIKIICLSNEMVSNVLDIIPSANNKCLVIPNIIDPIAGSVSFPNLPKKLVIGCTAAHINEKKGIANMLYVVKEFKKISNIPINFKVIGDIDDDLLREYQEIVSNLQVEKNVFFENYKTREECLKEEKSWDFYIQGSVCEGFCNSVGEAVSKSIPVFLSNTGFISELLKTSFPQLVYEGFNPSDIALKLLELMQLENKCQLYSDAYSLAYENAKEEQIIQKWRVLFDNRTKAKKVIKRTGNILAIALHEVSGDSHDHITTPEKTFYEFVDNLYTKGYGLCSFRDYMQMDVEERNRWIVCTFDDGYASLIEKVLPSLEAKGFTATVFMNSDLIGKDNSWNWKDSQRRYHLDVNSVLMLKEHGWEIGAHGHTHRNLLQLNEEELEYEFSQSQQILSSLVGEVKTYAYPYGASSPYVRKICNRYYEYAFGLYEGGTELCVDKMNIRRYSMDDIIKILDL